MIKSIIEEQNRRQQIEDLAREILPTVISHAPKTTTVGEVVKVAFGWGEAFYEVADEIRSNKEKGDR